MVMSGFDLSKKIIGLLGDKPMSLGYLAWKCGEEEKRLIPFVKSLEEKGLLVFNPHSEIITRLK